MKGPKNLKEKTRRAEEAPEGSPGWVKKTVKKNGTAIIEKDEFSEKIEENVKPKSTLILGISGGPDSMYLLHRCLWLAPELHLKLVVAHVNHGLRGKESEKDEQFVKEFCKRNGIIFHAHRLHFKKPATSKGRKNVEEAGRDARYKYFETLRKRLKAQWIVTAHHLNDNIETMLFNLIRGAHFNGIKAMEVTSPSRHLFRPMLGLTKKNILDFLKQNRIPYRVDASNDDTDLSRNWLRKNIIPLFPKLNANFEQTFKETLRNFSETAQWLERECEKWLKAKAGWRFKRKRLKAKAGFPFEQKGSNKNAKKMGIDLDIFLKEHSAFQKQLLAHLYKKIHNSTKKLNNKHLEEILRVLHLRQANKKKEFGKNTFLEVVWDHRKKRRYIRLITKK